MSKPLTAQRLRKTNIYAGVLHLAQMAAVLALSSDFSLPVTATYMSGPPGSTYAPPVTLFETPIGLTVAIFVATGFALCVAVEDGEVDNDEADADEPVPVVPITEPPAMFIELVVDS